MGMVGIVAFDCCLTLRLLRFFPPFCLQSDSDGSSADRSTEVRYYRQARRYDKVEKIKVSRRKKAAKHTMKSIAKLKRSSDRRAGSIPNDMCALLREAKSGVTAAGTNTNSAWLLAHLMAIEADMLTSSRRSRWSSMEKALEGWRSVIRFVEGTSLHSAGVKALVKKMFGEDDSVQSLDMYTSELFDGVPKAAKVTAPVRGGASDQPGAAKRAASAKPLPRRQGYSGRPESGPMYCSYCLQPGHAKAECKATAPTCRKCGVAGHVGRDCSGKPT